MKGNTISKKEMKRLMVQRKRDFIKCVFKEFMDAYNDALDCARDSTTMTVTIRNDNHYIIFEEFGKYLKICMYTNGNVMLWMKEHNEDEYDYCFFEYDACVGKQQEFIQKLRHGLARTIMNLALQKDISYKQFMQATWVEYEFDGAYDIALRWKAEGYDD